MTDTKGLTSAQNRVARELLKRVESELFEGKRGLLASKLGVGQGTLSGVLGEGGKGIGAKILIGLELIAPGSARLVAIEGDPKAFQLSGVEAAKLESRSDASALTAAAAESVRDRVIDALVADRVSADQGHAYRVVRELSARHQTELELYRAARTALEEKAQRKGSSGSGSEGTWRASRKKGQFSSDPPEKLGSRNR